MNFKKTTLATAVGATLAISGVASGVAYADGHAVGVYGRLNTAINMKEKDGGPFDEDSTNVSNIVSRFGVKASAPINASTTAFGQYEWSVNSDDEVGFGDGRQALVGVRGDFGTAQIGQMWSTFYNIVGTHLDPTVTLGAVLYSTSARLPYRTSNAIQYSNSFGAVNVSAEFRLADEDHPDEAPGAATEKIGGTDGNAIGASFTLMENLLLAVAVDNSDGVGLAGDETRTGFAAKWSQDNWWASFGFAETDIDDEGTAEQTQFHVGADFGDGLSGFIGFGTVVYDADGGGGDPDDTDATTLNLTKKIGNSGFRVYYEGVLAGDVFDGTDVYDHDQHIFGARLDF